MAGISNEGNRVTESKEVSTILVVVYIIFEEHLNGKKEKLIKTIVHGYTTEPKQNGTHR